MITFNGYQLETNNIILSGIDYESNTNKVVSVNESVRNGVIVAGEKFGGKTIPIVGTIIGTSASDLKSRIDELKKNLHNRHDKALVIDNRTYKATSSDLKFDRKNHTINVIGFSVNFICSDGFSIDTTETSLAQTGGNYSGASSEQTYAVADLDFDGTLAPYPVIEISFEDYSGIAAVETIKLENTNDDDFFSRTRIELIDTAVDGKTFVIDTKQCIVYEKVSGDQVNFKDGFPKFSLENNAVNLKITGTHFTVSWEVNYYKNWA